MLEEANICYKVKTNLTSADWFFAAASALIFPKHFSHTLSSKNKMDDSKNMPNMGKT